MGESDRTWEEGTDERTECLCHRIYLTADCSWEPLRPSIPQHPIYYSRGKPFPIVLGSAGMHVTM